MSPDVSIIIPAYNHEQFVESAVESALNQTYSSIEILLLNDGSTDSTGVFCERLVARHPGIRYFSHANMGAHSTINKGIEAASGRYIAVLNSDDLFFPYKIERCVDLAKKNRLLELIIGNVKLISADGTDLVEDIYIDWQKRSRDFYDACGLLPLSILNENFIMTTSNMFFKKELWEKIGGFQPLRFCHDLDFLMTAFHTSEYYYDKDTLHVMYRIHDANTIKKDPPEVRVEVAAVIASSLVQYNLNLVQQVDRNHIDHFIRFLKYKDISNLVLLLMILYLRLGGREAFYENLCKDEIRDIITSVEVLESKTTAESKQFVEELNSRLEETGKKLIESLAKLDRIQRHRGMRIVNYLSKRKFF